MLKLLQAWGEIGIEKNDGGGESNYIYVVRTFVNVTMNPQYNNNIINKKKNNIKKATDDNGCMCLLCR
jgi:hypothetical protein